jgi:Xaa-Pro aminopeptidase
MLRDETSSSHPASLGAKQLEPIDFEKRRRVFLSKMKDGVAVFFGAKEIVRNASETHPFRQDSAFYYLTGLDEPDAICLLSSNSKTPFQIFVRPKDKLREMWEGKRLGVEGAKKKLGADAAYDISNQDLFDSALVAALKEADSLHYSLGRDERNDLRMLGLLRRTQHEMRRTGRPLLPVRDPGEILNEMRVVKTRAEIQRMQIAADISAEAHAHAMRIAQPGMREYEIEAALYHTFRIRGASRVAYGSIVASGDNACCMHYRENSRKMEKNDLLLIDAAAEFDYYAADITRTFPVSGTFTPPQREIYEAVLRVQKACIERLRPGRAFRDIHAEAAELITEELKRLKVLKGSTAALLKKKEHSKYYPHSLGHWLGIDVHDVGLEYDGEYTVNRKLEAGMVLTVEPGLYFQPDDQRNSRYRGIGVRIEDDVVITTSGSKVLSTGVPKEIDEIESLCGQT